MAMIRKRQFRIVFDYGHGAAGQLMPSLLSELGCQELALNTAPDPLRLSRTEEEIRQAQEHLAATVKAIKADLGIRFDATGQRIYIVDNRARILGGHQALVLFVALAMERMNGGRVAVPVLASRAVDLVAGDPGQVLRTKTGPKALMQVAAARQAQLCGDENGGYIFPEFSPSMDGLFATAQLLQMLALAGRPLDAIVDSLPSVDVVHETLQCPMDAKGKVMRHLIEATAGQDVTLIDGVKVHRGEQWVALIPDPVRPLVHIYAEPFEAYELVAEYRRVIQDAVLSGGAEPAPEQELQTVTGEVRG